MSAGGKRRWVVGDGDLVIPERSMTPIGLDLPPGLSFERWSEIGRNLLLMGRAVMWWIGDWLNYGERAYGEKYSQAVDATGYDVQTLMNASWVCRSVEISRRREILSFGHHAEVASLSPGDQDRWLIETERQHWPIRELRSALRTPTAPPLASALPTPRRYGTVLADPPWQYGNNTKRLNGTTGRHYPDMALADICALPVRDIAAEDAVLLLWTTWPMLRDAFAVIDAWGFEYVTGLPWVKVEEIPTRTLDGGLMGKPTYGVGFWGRGCSELLLLCRRGEVAVRTPHVLLLSENFRHSQKPGNVYELAEHMPEPRLELFARGHARAGWDVFGNQVEGSIALVAD
jgi:N6-adenosine-specific RNA methylase IME4